MGKLAHSLLILWSPFSRPCAAGIECDRWSTLTRSLWSAGWLPRRAIVLSDPAHWSPFPCPTAFLAHSDIWLSILPCTLLSETDVYARMVARMDASTRVMAAPFIWTSQGKRCARGTMGRCQLPCTSAVPGRMYVRPTGWLICRCSLSPFSHLALLKRSLPHDVNSALVRERMQEGTCFVDDVALLSGRALAVYREIKSRTASSPRFIVRCTLLWSR